MQEVVAELRRHRTTFIIARPGAKSKSMQRGLATAVFEFLARSARTRIVAPDFWHSTPKCSGATVSRLFEHPLRFEIPINPGHPCCSADDQFSCVAPRSLARNTDAFPGLGRVRVPAIQKISPGVLAQFHPTREAICPIVGTGNPALVRKNQWQMNVMESDLQTS
jgi:hypothetical protein